MESGSLSKWKSAFPGLAAFILLTAIMIFPMESYQSALSGLNVFLQSVFPALLPFFIASEIMTGLGVVDFLSILLNPVMKPLFRCPGNSSFIWVMSMTSGYPTGARLTAMFLKEKKLTALEAQRILMFCSTSGPLFMIGAVAIGMMGTREGGMVILISHYAAAFLLGLCFRYYRSRNYRCRRPKMPHKPLYSEKKPSSRTILHQALLALDCARKKDGRPIGRLMGDAVRNSVNVLLVVGGFIILFSVVTNLLMHLQIIDWMASLAAIPMKAFSIDVPLLRALTGGLFEVTTGSKLVSETAVTMQAKIAGVSFVIGWSGLSIHAQSASFLSGTGVKISIYILGKFLHGLLAAVLSLPFTALLYPEAMAASKPALVASSPVGWKEAFLCSIGFLLTALLMLFLFIVLSRIWLQIRKIFYQGKRQL